MLEQLHKRTPSSTRYTSNQSSYHILSARKSIHDESMKKLLPIVSQPKISLTKTSRSPNTPTLSIDSKKDLRLSSISGKRKSNHQILAFLGNNESRNGSMSNYADKTSNRNSRHISIHEPSLEDSRHSHHSIQVKDQVDKRFPNLPSKERATELRNERVERVRDLQTAIMDLKLQISDFKHSETSALVDFRSPKDNMVLRLKARKLRERLERANKVINVTNNRVLKAISSIVGSPNVNGRLTEQDFKVLSEQQLAMLLHREGLALQNTLISEQRINEYLKSKFESLQSGFSSEPSIKPQPDQKDEVNYNLYNNHQRELLEMMRVKNDTMSTKKLRKS